MVIHARRLIVKPRAKHIGTHNVSPDEVEEVARSSHIVLQGAGKKRLVLLGETEAGRILEVVLEPKGEKIYYVITAYPASSRMTSLYRGKMKGGGSK